MRKLSVYIFSLLLFAGCARVPKNDLAQTIDAPPIASTESRGTSFFAKGEWPSEKWWEMFQDPQLNQLIERALSQNFSLKEAHAKVETAYQLAKKQRARLLPDLSGNYVEQWQYLSKYGFDRDFFPMPPGAAQGIPHTLNLIDLTLNFSYEFDFWGKNRDLFRAALGRAQADVAEEKQARLLIAIKVAEAYFSLQTKLAQQEVLLDKRQERKDFLFLRDMRCKAGLDDALPLYASEKRIHQVQKLLVFLEEGIELDRHTLKYLISAGPQEKVIESLPIAHYDAPFPLPDNIESDLIARRPDLIAQIWRVEAAAKEIGAAKADFYPNINLGAFAGLESLSFGNLFRDSKMGGLTPAIHLPIFTGGRLEAQLKSKVWAFNEAVFSYNDLVLKAAKEVADQICTVRATCEGLTEQTEMFEDSSSEYALVALRYEKGLDNLLNVLQREDEVLQQRFLLAGLYNDHLLSLLKLIKSLGGGYYSSKKVEGHG